MKEAMELLSNAFDTLNNTLVLGSEAGKISVVKAQIQKAYEILHREAEEQEKDKRELVALKYQLEDAKRKQKSKGRRSRNRESARRKRGNRWLIKQFPTSRKRYRSLTKTSLCLSRAARRRC